MMMMEMMTKVYTSNIHFRFVKHFTWRFSVTIAVVVLGVVGVAVKRTRQHNVTVKGKEKEKRGEKSRKKEGKGREGGEW